MDRFLNIIHKTLAPLTEIDVGHANLDSLLTKSTDTGCCFAGRGLELKCSRVFVNLLDKVWSVDDVNLHSKYGKGAYWETMLLAIESSSVHDYPIVKDAWFGQCRPSYLKSTK